MEPQRRGAPHYHLIGNLNDNINVFVLRRQVALSWYEVCKTQNYKHLVAGTGVEFIKDTKTKMQMYVCKYIGKVDTTEYEGWAHPGRFWGIIGRMNLPSAIAIVFTMDKAEYFVLRRLIRR